MLFETNKPGIYIMKGWIKYNYVNEAWGRKTSWAALISREGINNQIHNF